MPYKNKDKLRKYKQIHNAEYYEKHKEEIRRRKAEWYQKNKEKRIAAQREYRHAASEQDRLHQLALGLKLLKEHETDDNTES